MEEKSRKSSHLNSKPILGAFLHKDISEFMQKPHTRENTLRTFAFKKSDIIK